MGQSSPPESQRLMDDEAISRLWAEDLIGSLREMTPGQAARRVGQELQFGEPIGLEWERSYPALLMLGWILGAAAASGMFAAMAGVDVRADVSKPLVLACIAVLLLVCCLLIAVGWKRRVPRGWLARYRYGYVELLAGDPGPRAVRWASVTEVTATYRTATTNSAPTAAPATFMDSFSARPFIGRLAPTVGSRWQPPTLMRDALGAVGVRLLTAMIEAYDSGRLVAFGSVRIDQHGVVLPGRDLVVSWGDIRAIRMRHVGGVLREVRLSCHGRARHRKIVISGLPNGIFLPRVIAHAAARHGVPVKGRVTPSSSLLGLPPVSR